MRLNPNGKQQLYGDASMDFDQSKVKEFYEQHPYPFRTAEPEKLPIQVGLPSDIRFINHHIFEGRRDFSKPFRMLVAGGGTGDAVVGLGSQLKALNCPAEITYIDLSEASRAIAERRATAAMIPNTRFLLGRIQDLPDLVSGKFDYIDFCGVINHVGDQAAVLGVLASLVAPGGGIGVMAYGTLGRSGVYQVQEMLRAVGAHRSPDGVAMARALIESLPATSQLKRNPVFENNTTISDVEIADRYLNPSDRSFTVEELQDLAVGAGLKIAAFAPSIFYNPMTLLRDEGLRNKVKSLSWIERCAFAEKMGGNIAMHNYYMIEPGRHPNPERLIEDGSAIPTLVGLSYGAAPRVQNNAYEMDINVGPQSRHVSLPGSEMTAPILREIDGQRTLKKIHKSLKANLSWRTFLREFLILYQGLHGAGNLVLSTTPMPRI